MRGAWWAVLLLLLCCGLAAGTEESEYVSLLRRSRRLAAASATPYSRLRLGIDTPTLYGYEGKEGGMAPRPAPGVP